MNSVIGLLIGAGMILAGFLVTYSDFCTPKKERVERKEITASTLGNYVKTIMFCDVTDIPFNGRKLQEDCQRGKDMQMIEHPLWKRSIKSSNILIEE